jgi:electron transport complex protein RnfC
MKLMPVLMYKATIAQSIEEMKSTHLMDCIECGCCAYTCPGSVPLVMGFRSGKHILREAMAKEKARAKA